MLQCYPNTTRLTYVHIVVISYTKERRKLIMNEVERFQQLKSKVDAYNASVIENEVKKKNAEDELAKLQEDLKIWLYPIFVILLHPKSNDMRYRRTKK